MVELLSSLPITAVLFKLNVTLVPGMDVVVDFCTQVLEYAVLRVGVRAVRVGAEINM